MRATAPPLRRRIATMVLSLSVILGVSGTLVVFGQMGRAEAALPKLPAAQASPDASALDYLHHIAVGNNGAVVAAMEPQLQRQLPPPALGRAWVGYLVQHGRFLSPGRQVVAQRGELTVVTVPLNMERKPGRFEIAFRHGRIAGLHLLEP